MAIALAFIAENPYIQFFWGIVATLVLGRIAYFILDKIVHRLTRKTKSDLDDILLARLKNPAYIVIILGGAYHSFKLLPIPPAYFSYVQDVFFILVAFTLAWIAHRVIAVLIPRWLMVGKSFEKTPKILSRILSSAIYFIALLTVLDHFGVAITPLVTTLGIGGIAVGLALQDTLSNFFAGLHIVTDQPVKIGDFIEVEGALSVVGYVEDIGWRSTRVKTLSNNIVILPNFKLAQSIIINHAMPEPPMDVKLTAGVSYESDLVKVEKVALEAARHVQNHVKGGLKKWEPTLRFNNFADSNIEFYVNLRVIRFEDKFFVTSEYIKELKRRFDKAGIVMNYPTRRIIQDSVSPSKKR